jgi:CHASE2 domain-containing sensor protein
MAATVLALALIGAGVVLVRWTWLGFAPALAGALILPLPSWLVTAVHSVGH